MRLPKHLSIRHQKGRNLTKKATNKPQRSMRIHQAVAQKLGSEILEGKYPPESLFPGEIEHSAFLNVSRTPYREAIRTLVAKGLLESRPRTGTRVTRRDRWNLLDPDILAWMFSSTPDKQFIHDLFELRNVLEPTAAMMAAKRRTQEQLLRIESALKAMQNLGLASIGGQEADQQFHAEILLAAGNQALSTLTSSVGAAVRWTTHYKQSSSVAPRDPFPEHEAVYLAIANSDPDAAKAAMEYLVRQALLDMHIEL